jgi:hypothetical protein
VGTGHSKVPTELAFERFKFDAVSLKQRIARCEVFEQKIFGRLHGSWLMVGVYGFLATQSISTLIWFHKMDCTMVRAGSTVT